MQKLSHFKLYLVFPLPISLYLYLLPQVSEIGTALERRALKQAYFGGCGSAFKHESQSGSTLHWGEAHNLGWLGQRAAASA